LPEIELVHVPKLSFDKDASEYEITSSFASAGRSEWRMLEQPDEWTFQFHTLRNIGLGDPSSHSHYLSNQPFSVKRF